MKKKIIKVIAVILLILITQQLYWYFRLGGNLGVYVCNESEIDSTKISLYLDDKEVINEYFNDNPYLSCKNLIFKVSPGKHKLVAVANDGAIKEEYYFYSTLVTRITMGLGTEFSSKDGSEKLSFYFSSEWVYKRLVIE